jgi:cytosol alanyl aminopeptidase
MYCRAVFFLLLAALACAAQPPKLKLDDSVRPVRYAADLTLLTDSPTFSGSIDIDVELRNPSGLIWLNATDILIRQATVRAGASRQTGVVEPGNANFVGLRFPAEVPAGAARLHIQYEGKITPTSTAGIFQGRDANISYLFTQFEATDARRAFPCFDQPNFKTPWQLTLHIKKENLAISNTPQTGETEEANGMKRVTFGVTKPLPSYLVAFAVGPFDIVDGGQTGANHIPVRIIAPKGKAYQAKYAAEVTGPIIQQLENYFGIPFPIEKADQVAIPLTFGFGAMENAGMVTYAATILLSDPALDTEQRQRRYASVAAHELAHQWFGDLVTLAWWDDTWLNEAFATWTSSKIIAQWKPEWNSRLSDLGTKFGAMREDSLVAARQIRQPIESMNDISNAFDGITYQKGAAVIRMFESWVGEKQFQAGVTGYLKRYASKNASAGDFLDAIAGTGQPRLTRAFSTFLQQPGLPQITVSLKCDGAPRVALSQKRYLPTGSAGAKDEKWQTPVCVRYPSSQGPQKECFLLDQSSAEFHLTKAAACPAYLSGNDGASGYYETSYQGDLLPGLLEHSNDFLSAAERRTLLHDLTSLASAGEVPAGQVFDAISRFANAPERQIVEEARDAARDFRQIVPPPLLPNYRRFIRKAFGVRAAALGWTAKPGESTETRLLRATLVPFVADTGDEPALQAEALRLANRWLMTRQGIDPDMLDAVLSAAAISGNRAFFDGLLGALKKTSDRHTRGSILAALGDFRDPALARAALQLLLEPDLDARESFYALLMTPLFTPETERLPLEFIKSNYDRLLARLPSGGGFEAGASLPAVGQSFCDEPSRREFTGFFQNRSQQFNGEPRTYAQTLETIRLCEARKAAEGPGVAAFLSGQ